MSRSARRKFQESRRRIAGAPPFGDPHADLIALWALRILLDFNGLRKYESVFFLNQASIFRTVGLHPAPTEDLELPELRELLLKRQEEVEALKPEVAGLLASNLRLLADCLALSSSEVEILAFVTCLETHEALVEMVGTLGDVDSARVLSALSVILGLPREDVRAALSPEGTLTRSGLVRLNNNGGQAMQLKVSVLKGFSESMFLEQSDPIDLMRLFFRLAEPSHLTVEDFSHIREGYELLLRYLHAGREQGITGMNVLLYGPAGSGKTQLVRTLADHLVLSLYEVSMEKDGGEPLQGYQRFNAYQLCQSILARKRDCLVIFDEIEDVFPEPAPFFGMTPRTDGVKAWLNRLLETNPVPTLWVSNDISQIDPAYLRRFDFVLELRSPPRTWRRRIIEKHTSCLTVREKWVEATADHEHLQPAHVERAARVARLVGDKKPESVERTLNRVLQGTFKALGAPLGRSGGRNGPTPYRLDVLNPDADLERLTAGLSRNPRGRICLYGVPGSGKSAYAQYVASEVERPLLVRRASDLISKYIGETEKNTAEVFHQAEADNAVLLLDEADSFLRDRTTAVRTWEVSQVNEFLVQMETFEGLFLASTNLMDTLDAASLRRFDLKIRFDYMRPEQAWLLFVQVMQERGYSEDAIAHDVHEKVFRLTSLTPGDFATALRREHIMGDTFGPDALVEALEAECSVKPDVAQRGIGFKATL